MIWNDILSACGCETALVGVAILLLVIYLILSRNPKNFPPGPLGLPIVGYAPFFGDNAAEDLRKMKKKYGPVMSVQMGTENWVVLNDFHAINEALVKQGEKFSGRPSNVILNLLTDGCGVALVDYGRIWKDLRKFGLTTLRGFGVGKKGMEENIIEETSFLVESLTTNNPDSCSTKLTKSVSNIICRVVLGSRFEYDDDRFTTLIRILREYYTDSMDGKLFGLIMAAPALRHLPVFRSSFKKVLKEEDVANGILRDIVEEHKKSFDKEHIRDFIDAFLAEIATRGSGVDESFNERQLLQYIRDLFEAGSGTTSSTLHWGLLALVNYPDCQEKIADEVYSAIGDSGLPTMKHREQMPYTCAFIHELMRHRTLAPLSLMHKTNQRCSIRGYTIPKDTTVIPNIWSVHYDQELFENPEEFYPERFLNSDGKFVKSSNVIPFSVGPRFCLGEQLARMEVFIFLVGIVQKLKIIPDPKSPPPPLTSGSYFLLTTYEPPDFKLQFVKR